MDQIRAQEEGFAVRYLERIMNATAADRQAAVDRFGNDPLPQILSINGNIASISITGPLSPLGPSPLARYYGYGGTGYADIISAVREVKDNATITEVIFPTNTPGGLVTMLDETRHEIAELAKVKKVTFENHGMIASGGMWLAAVPGAKIIATSPTVETGSIGVKIVGYDATEALKEMGYKKIVILSRNAPNKAAGLDTEDGIAENQRQADAMERIFISRVANGRGVSEETVIKEFGKGGLLVAQDPDPARPDAISVGMIDSIATGIAVLQTEDINDDAPEAQQETKTMTLKELFAANPGAEAEHNALVSAAHMTGAEASQAKTDARIEAAKPFLSAESEYPQAITKLATKVVMGTVDSSALTAAVAAFDATKQNAESVAAAAEEVEETAAEEHSQGNAAGVTETNDDFEATVAAARKSRGLGDS